MIPNFSSSRPFEMDSLPQQHLLHSSCSNHYLSVSEYYRKGLDASGMAPSMMLAPTEYSLSHLPPILDRHLTHSAEASTLSPSWKKVSDHPIITSFSVQQYAISQQSLHPLNAHDHHQLASEHFSSSSSFISSVNEEPLRRRSNNSNVVTNSSNNYNLSQRYYPSNNRNWH